MKKSGPKILYSMDKMLTTNFVVQKDFWLQNFLVDFAPQHELHSHNIFQFHEMIVPTW